MAISKEKKQAQIEALRKAASEAHAVTIAVNHGVTSNDMNDLRKRSRDENVLLMVAKNNLAKHSI